MSAAAQPKTTIPAVPPNAPAALSVPQSRVVPSADTPVLAPSAPEIPTESKKTAWRPAGHGRKPPTGVGQTLCSTSREIKVPFGSDDMPRAEALLKEKFGQKFKNVNDAYMAIRTDRNDHSAGGITGTEMAHYCKQWGAPKEVTEFFFNRLDDDGSGRIDMGEFNRVMHMIFHGSGPTPHDQGGPRDYPEVRAPWAYDGDEPYDPLVGRIARRPSVDVIANKITQKYADLSKAYQGIDKEGDNEITLAEMARFCDRWGAPEKFTTQLLSDMDKDGDGTITRVEFNELLGPMFHGVRPPSTNPSTKAPSEASQRSLRSQRSAGGTPYQKSRGSKAGSKAGSQAGSVMSARSIARSQNSEAMLEILSPSSPMSPASPTSPTSPTSEVTSLRKKPASGGGAKTGSGAKKENSSKKAGSSKEKSQHITHKAKAEVKEPCPSSEWTTTYQSMHTICLFAPPSRVVR